MKNKKNRLQIITELLRSNVVGSQEALSNLLIERGCQVTQATLSRDLKQLKVSKTHLIDGSYKYSLPIENKPQLKEGNLSKFSTGIILSVEFSGNIAVIRTKPGYANAVGWSIDNESPAKILGTVAGDDTVVLVMREDSSKEEILTSLQFILPQE